MIQLRADTRQARRELAAVQTQLAAVRAEMARANAASDVGSKGIPGLSRWGNQLQWAGRQLQYNFTLPIALATGAAVKFALDNEKAMVRIQKVYGDNTRSAQFYSKEIQSLSKYFEVLSERFAVNRADVLDIAAAWSAAGSSGAALARATRLTLETMVLGELDAASATQALISIQAQYNFSTKQLSSTIDVLNMIENQTGISMAGLIDGFSRSAGVARTAGIDIQHLGAMLAALTPAAGSAANAGNALKTIISRLLSPTKEAKEVMTLMHLNIKETAWQSLNGTQRLEALAGAYGKLNGAQKIVVASTIASRWQINRFDVLMKDLNNDLGYYNRSLKATQSDQGNFNQKVSELNYVLNSSPQRLKQIWIILQNVMADVVQPLIPLLVRLGSGIANAANWFERLSPQVQATTLGLLLFLAAIGPIARYIGAVASLMGLLKEASKFLERNLYRLALTIKTDLTNAWLRVLSVMSFVGDGIAAAGSIIVKAFATVMLNIVGTMQMILMPALRGMGTMMLQAMTPALLAVRSAVVMTLRQMGGAVVASMSMIGTSLMSIWGSIFTQLGALMAAGTGRLVAIWIVMSSRITQTAVLLLTNIPRLFAAMETAITAFTGRLLVTIPLIFSGIGNIARAGIVGMGAGITRGIGGIVTMLIAWGPRIGAALLSPWTAAILIVVGLLYHFRDQVSSAFRGIVGWVSGAANAIPNAFHPVIDFFHRAVQFISDAFWRLPASITGAFITVVQIVKTAAMKVYELFSYLNPFAHHSPSLVESVTKGMDHIKAQHASVGDAGAPFAKAANDMSSYKQTASSLDAAKSADQTAQIAKGMPTLLPQFNKLTNDLRALNVVLAQQKALVDAQQAVVNHWSDSLDRANAALDAEQTKLDAMQKQLDALTASYDAHKTALENFASAPLQGMQAMSDAMFANDIAQKKLQLQMMDWEKVNGSIDDVKNHLASLQGDIDTLNSKAGELRAAGAGSDVLGPIDAQIKAMQSQRTALQKGVDSSPMAGWQKQLDQLKTEGERLSLINSITFDPLQREIGKLANAQKEMSFQDIVAGILRERAAMDQLQPRINAATEAVARQKAAVDAAQAARDAISKQYDIERKKLDELNKAYSQTESLIGDIKSALSDMGSAASDAASKAKAAADAFKTPGALNFKDATGAANFPDVGGGSKIGREGGAADQAAQIDQMTRDLQKELEGAFGKFDMFQPVKDAWNKAWKWVEDNIGPHVKPVIDGVGRWFSQLGGTIGGAIHGFQIPQAVKDIFGRAVDIGKGAWKQITDIFNLFAPDVKHTWNEIVAGVKDAWNQIGPELEKFGGPLGDLGKAFSNIWAVVRPVAEVIGGVLLLALKTVASVISDTVKPVIDTIAGVIAGVIRVIRGLFEFVVGVFSGDWKMAWKGITDIVGGAFDTVASVVKGGINIVIGIIKGFVSGIVGFFQWLYDKLVGHSIIPDLIRSIISWIASLPQKAWNALASFGSMIVSRATAAWNWFSSESARIWGIFIGWVRGLPQSAYNGIIALKDKLIGAASTAWTWFRNTSSTHWNIFIAWVRGIPQAVYNGIITIKDKLIGAAASGFQALKDKAVSIVDGKNGLIAWVKGIPGKIANAMSGVGGAVLGAVKSSWNAAAGWLNKYGLANVNKVTEKFGLHINSLPTFAKGGIVPGGQSKKDNMLIAARSGEGVIVPELVRALGGARGLRSLNDAAAKGRMGSLDELAVQHFANGGVVGAIGGLLGGVGGAIGGAISGIGGQIEGWLEKGAGFALDHILAPLSAGIRALLPGDSAFEDLMAGSLDQLRAAARSWGNKTESGGNKQLPGIGWQWQEKVLRDQFPNIVFTSAYRPGSITDSGNVSYHALGRAVDMTPDPKYFDWILANYGKTSKELIYSPENMRQIKDGKPFMYTGTTRAMHFNHVHWAYDQGGILNPGITMAHNRTGRGELVLTGADADRLFNVITMMDRAMAKSGNGPTPGAASVARMTTAVASMEAKLRASQPSYSDTVRGGDQIGTQNNFYGDLSFPNIENGDDAESFIKHLESLAGGK